MNGNKILKEYLFLFFNKNFLKILFLQPIC